MSEVIYTFYVENNAVPEVNISPVITKMIDIDTGLELSPSPSIVELSDGFYKFSYTWTVSSSSTGYLIKIDTGDLATNTAATRYITMRIEPNDYLSVTAADIKVSADSLVSSANSILDNSNRILDIEHGTWKIEGNQLKLYSAGFGRNADETIAIYDLKDENGNPTNTSPFERRLNTLVTVP